MALEIDKISTKKWFQHPTTLLLIFTVNIALGLFNTVASLNKESIQDLKEDRKRLLLERDVAYKERDEAQDELKNLILEVYLQKSILNQVKDSVIKKQSQ